MAYKKWTQSATQLKPDTRYDSLLVSKFINCLMWDGKRSVAARLFYDAMGVVAKRVKDEPPEQVFEQAISNCKPNVEVRSKRVGGSNYQVPMPVNRKRQQSSRFVGFAMRPATGKADRRLKPWLGRLLTPTGTKVLR